MKPISAHDPSPSWTRRAVPLYGQLLVVDPSMSGVDEPDLRRVLEDADAAIVGGSRSRAAIKAGQDAAAIGFDVSPGSTYRSTLSLTGRINATCWAQITAAGADQDGGEQCRAAAPGKPKLLVDVGQGR